MKTLARPRDREELLRRLRTVRPDSARRWGRMSAHQMICHLCDAFRMSMGEKPVRPVGGPIRRTLVRWYALYVPIRWPSGIRTRPELDQERLGTRPVDFAADVAQLEALIELVATESRHFQWHAHPLLGTMSDGGWLRWGYLHVDHHLRQFGA
jgi:hypothetical protein